ncbi:hypothetical protein TcG_07926 [Trypanosoma cruzi]|nr:hypothetical protein TcG_07926 [Trypanosoma cruzi]
MATGCIAATWVCLLALVRLSRNQDCSVVETFGCKGGANSHVSFCWDGATLHGGCVGLRWRWEGDGITGVMASALLFVGGCYAFLGTVCGRMPLRATVFGYCCRFLLIFWPSS